jgi:hypothetical protein
VYVFVTVIELEGEGREQDLGTLPETMILEQVKDLVLSLVEKQLPPDAREDPRHLWHNDRIHPKAAMLGDLASGSEIVSLELRPDLYRVAIPGEGEQLVAFNSEETAASFIRLLVRELLGASHGAACCYELRVDGGDTIDADRDLFSQKAFPQTSLILRRRSAFYAWSLGVLGLAIVVGFGLGYLSGVVF